MLIIGNGMQSGTTVSLKVYLMAIAVKYTLSDTVVFDCIPFPIFTHITGITYVLDYYECAAMTLAKPITKRIGT